MAGESASGAEAWLAAVSASGMDGVAAGEDIKGRAGSWAGLTVGIGQGGGPEFRGSDWGTVSVAGWLCVGMCSGATLDCKPAAVVPELGVPGMQEEVLMFKAEDEYVLAGGVQWGHV